MKTPPDPDEQNDDRAVWAEAALQTFIAKTRTDREDAVADLVTDLAHWCDRNGTQLAKELERAQGAYLDETDQEGQQFDL